MIGCISIMSLLKVKVLPTSFYAVTTLRNYVVAKFTSAKIFEFFRTLILWGQQKQKLKVGHSRFNKICFICLKGNPLKMMKNTFYIILKALFVVKIFNFLS